MTDILETCRATILLLLLQISNLYTVLIRFYVSLNEDVTNLVWSVKYSSLEAVQLCDLSIGPGNRKVPGSMPSSISCCCFLEQGTLLSLLQSAQLHKWVNLSHQYCEEFGDLSPEGAVQVWRDLPGEGFHSKKKC